MKPKWSQRGVQGVYSFYVFFGTAILEAFWKLGRPNGSQMGANLAPIGSKFVLKIRSKSRVDFGVHSGGLPLVDLLVLPK